MAMVGASGGSMGWGWGRGGPGRGACLGGMGCRRGFEGGGVFLGMGQGRAFDGFLLSFSISEEMRGE